MNLNEFLMGKQYLIAMHNAYKNLGYKEGKKYYTDMELVYSKTISKLAGSFTVYIYMYPKYSISTSITNVSDNKEENNFYDDNIEEKLGGAKELLGV